MIFTSIEEVKPMAHKEEWITTKEAAKILTDNSGHPVSTGFVRRLGSDEKVTTKKLDERTKLYLKSDIEAYKVKQRGDGSVRPWYMRLPKHVKLINSSSIWFKCDICGQEWSPNLLPGGKLPRGSKMCPNGCTAAAANKGEEKSVA
jgi:hypothetical protein